MRVMSDVRYAVVCVYIVCYAGQDQTYICRTGLEDLHDDMSE